MKLNGYIKVCSESGKVLADVRNAVTSFWEELVAAQGIGTLFSHVSAIEAGQNFIYSPLYFEGGMGIRYDTNNTSLITVYLLNLNEAEKKALNKNSNIVPVYNSSFEIDNNKVVGFATAKFSATETKEGYLQPVTGESLINSKRHALKWRWDVGVLTGTYNTIAVGFNVLKNPYNGASVYRGLEMNNQIIGETAAGGYLVRPGVKSADGSVIITTDEEILLGDSSSTSKGRKILNLVTGEITLLNADDDRYNFPLMEGIHPQLAIGDYLVTSENNGTLNKTNIKTKAVERITSSGYDAFTYNGYLYSRYNDTTYRAYTLTNLTYTSSGNLNISDMNFPPEFLESRNNYYYRISSIGDKYLVTYNYTYASTTTIPYTYTKALICSDPTNIKGSIIEIIPNLNTSLGVIVGGKKVFFNHYLPFMYGYSETYKNQAGTGANSINKRGLKMTTEGLYGNLISFKTFDEDQTLPTDEGINLTYYYTFEQ